ncbi:MAG: glycosyltransferase family 9 protein [Ignavibacteria bacterium]|nr:glycosyltransferase family 9 protein [Ignavibacteria bacterium]
MKRKPIYRKLDRYLGIPIVQILRLFKKKRKREFPKRIRSIFFIKFAAIGDIVLLLPTIRLLRKNFPDAKITFLCSELNVEMVKRISYLDEVISINVYEFIKNIFKFVKFIKFLRAKEYDLVIDGEQWSRIDTIITAFMRHKYLIGYKLENQYKHYFFDATADHLSTRHEVENFLALLEPLGIFPKSNEDKKLKFFLTEDEEKFARDYWNTKNLNDKFVIVFHPGFGTDGYARDWNINNFINLGKKIISDFPFVRIIISGSQNDLPICEKIAEGIKEYSFVLVQKYLGKALSVIKSSDVVVCGNTGILHMAAGLGTKTISLNGPTNPKIWGAYSDNAISIQSDIYCSPCLYLGHEYGCNKPNCMDRIKVDDVYVVLRKCILEKNKLT